MLAAVTRSPGEMVVEDVDEPRRARRLQAFLAPFPLARAAEAFEFAMSRPPDAVKIVVNVN